MKILLKTKLNNDKKNLMIILGILQLCLTMKFFNTFIKKSKQLLLIIILKTEVIILIRIILKKSKKIKNKYSTLCQQ